MTKIVLFLALTALSTSQAATIAYWQFDDGTDGATAGGLLTEVNAPTLNGAGVAAGTGAAPKFNLDVPGLMITDGLAGPSINPSNDVSLEFNNTDLPGNPNGLNGSRVTVQDPGGLGSLLKPASFTIEGFVKMDGLVNFASIFSKGRADAGGSSWSLDTDGAGHLRSRFDTQALGLGSGNPGFNQPFTTTALLTDGLWHHVALTYNGADRDVDLYFDYARVGGGTAVNALAYDDTLFSIGQGGGGRAFDGRIDEVRLSDTVLSTNSFLQAVPEPGVSSLALIGVAFFMGRRRRANRR